MIDNKLFFLLSLIAIPISAFSAGSTVNNSTISNTSNIKNSTNTSLGGIGKAEANQGSIVVKGANLTNATIVNNATVKNSSNIARSAEANQGSIKISKSLNGVTVVNKANITNSANVATGGLFGTNSSDQGSIIFK
jgi:hypothetical protein